MFETLEKLCTSCGMPVRGRRDKKFCSDQCRSAHYNRVNFGSSLYVRHVNNVLRKNWRILHELDAPNGNAVTEDVLRIRGFDFNYFTSIHPTHNGECYYYCYDLGYIRTARNLYQLVERKV